MDVMPVVELPQAILHDGSTDAHMYIHGLTRVLFNSPILLTMMYVTIGVYVPFIPHLTTEWLKLAFTPTMSRKKCFSMPLTQDMVLFLNVI